MALYIKCGPVYTNIARYAVRDLNSDLKRAGRSGLGTYIGTTRVDKFRTRSANDAHDGILANRILQAHAVGGEWFDVAPGATMRDRIEDMSCCEGVGSSTGLQVHAGNCGRK